MKDWQGNRNSIFKTLGASNHTDNDREADDFYATDPRAERCPNCVSRISYLRRHKPHDCHGATDRPALNNRQSAAHHSDNRCAADGKAQRTARRSAAHRTKG